MYDNINKEGPIAPLTNYYDDTSSFAQQLFIKKLEVVNEKK